MELNPYCKGLMAIHSDFGTFTNLLKNIQSKKINRSGSGYQYLLAEVVLSLASFAMLYSIIDGNLYLEKNLKVNSVNSAFTFMVYNQKKYFLKFQPIEGKADNLTVDTINGSVLNYLADKNILGLHDLIGRCFPRYLFSGCTYFKKDNNTSVFDMATLEKDMDAMIIRNFNESTDITTQLLNNEEFPYFKNDIKSMHRNNMGLLRGAIFEAIDGITLQKQIEDQLYSISGNNKLDIVSTKELYQFILDICSLGLTTGFVHNDAHLNNIFWDVSTKSYKFIDLGRSFFNYDLLSSYSNQIDNISKMEYLKLNPEIYISTGMPQINIKSKDIRVMINKWKDIPMCIGLDPYIVNKYQILKQKITGTPVESKVSELKQQITGTPAESNEVSELNHFKKYMFIFDIMTITMDIITIVFPLLSQDEKTIFFNDIGISVLNGVIRVLKPEKIIENTTANVTKMLSTGTVSELFQKYYMYILGVMTFSIFFHKYLIPNQDLDELKMFPSFQKLKDKHQQTMSLSSSGAFAHIKFREFCANTGIMHTSFQITIVPNPSLLDKVLEENEDNIRNIISFIFPQLSAINVNVAALLAIDSASRSSLPGTAHGGYCAAKRLFTKDSAAPSKVKCILKSLKPFKCMNIEIPSPSKSISTEKEKKDVERLSKAYSNRCTVDMMELIAQKIKGNPIYTQDIDIKPFCVKSDEKKEKKASKDLACFLRNKNNVKKLKSILQCKLKKVEDIKN